MRPPPKPPILTPTGTPYDTFLEIEEYLLLIHEWLMEMYQRGWPMWGKE